MYKFHVICLVFVLVRVKHFLHEGFLHVFFKSMFCFLIKANFLLLFCVFVNWNGGLDKYIFLYVYLLIAINLSISIYLYIYISSVLASSDKDVLSAEWGNTSQSKVQGNIYWLSP